LGFQPLKRGANRFAGIAQEARHLVRIRKTSSVPVHKNQNVPITKKEDLEARKTFLYRIVG
jgi:hypothetical protein